MLLCRFFSVLHETCPFSSFRSAKCATDSANIPSRYRFFSSSSLPSSPLNLCVILSLNHVAQSLSGYFELTIREYSFSLSPLPSLLLPLLSSLSPSGMMPDFRASLCVSQSVSIAFSISYSRRLWSPSNSSNFPYIILFGLSVLLLLPHQTKFISKRRADVIYMCLLLRYIIPEISPARAMKIYTVSATHAVHSSNIFQSQSGDLSTD